VTRDAKFVADWQIRRAKGRQRYLVQIGLLGFGLTMFLSMTAADLIENRHNLSLHHLVFRILFAAITWSLAGLWFGASMWSVNERRCRRQLERLSVQH
jgi:hypothetical protein